MWKSSTLLQGEPCPSCCNICQMGIKGLQVSSGPRFPDDSPVNSFTIIQPEVTSNVLSVC